MEDSLMSEELELFLNKCLIHVNGYYPNGESNLTSWANCYGCRLSDFCDSVQVDYCCKRNLNQRLGNTSFHFENGDKFEGQWIKGQDIIRGTYLTKEGKIFEANYSTRSKDVTISHKFENTDRFSLTINPAKDAVLVEQHVHDVRRIGLKVGRRWHGKTKFFWPLGIVVDCEWNYGEMMSIEWTNLDALLNKVKFADYRPVVKTELEKLVGELDTAMLVNVLCPQKYNLGIYVGHLKDGKYHGRCLFITDGDWFIKAEVANNQYHGEVVRYDADSLIHRYNCRHSNCLKV